MTDLTGVRTVLITICVVLGHTQYSSAQPPLTPIAQAAIDEATQLDAFMEQLYNEGKFQEAILIAERSLAFREMVRGPCHPEIAQSLSNLATIYQAQGALAKDEPLYLRALDILHPDIAASLHHLVTLYRAQGASAKTVPLARAVAIQEAQLRLALARLSEPRYCRAAFIPSGDWAPPAPHLIKPQEHGR